MFKSLLILSALLVSGACFAEKTENNKQTTSIYFETDKSEIKKDEENKLTEIAEAIRYEKLVVVIVGHADKRADRLYNLDLAERRANAVKNALVAAGAPEDQFLIEISQGEEKPIAPNDELSAHLQANRRVDVIMTRPMVQNQMIILPVRVIKRNRVTLLGGFAPSGLLNPTKVAPNTFRVKEDFDFEIGASYSFLTPLLNDRLSITVTGLTNKSGFLGLGLDF